MYNKIHRNSEYLNRLKEFIFKKYCINAIAISPAKRGYYGETWRLEASNHTYFVKIDYFPRHQELFKNSLSVVEYLCNNNIDFIGNIIKTYDGKLYSIYNSATLGIFEYLPEKLAEVGAPLVPYPCIWKKAALVARLEYADAEVDVLSEAHFGETT